ncbi:MULTISPECIES: aspartyl-phosphate phosphatase Spo0E family protein [Aneurinibacillus]|uniref:Aspartyl-phosphate phosphatase Spo0E family protein n=1 Tax=Aneurinibacillus thermoaerophilus TaxID=143495 RepID=A0A1G7Y569_ANETH|nr:MULTISPECIES: aspartyl-phosphate phosphatase Spo0E family protein [Aneurinibacillus]AMA72863.1 hypothetical protein ACH33_08350 [Aneurinibacillus sp. XH2]MED0677644.1 aspartyl-phosphate phosphatase Spo0E family protein [Aneurinibacillus thermoaerophilus]MED0680050.1 aspartyl-phosphate phosphatase Spo0E family protein [Aneurinibacillus thermoaerophilus]MED0736771.1 aspartyl-phosphate phosphatase Spo0E family protein [Aneurinibacillus thermoaerophilus]MED0758191.1 aspartyl-phosphate phosphata
MNEEEFLLCAIEEAREELNRVASVRKLTDPAVIAMSKKLDKLINQYYSYKIKQKNTPERGNA